MCRRHNMCQSGQPAPFDEHAIDSILQRLIDRFTPYSAKDIGDGPDLARKLYDLAITAIHTLKSELSPHPDTLAKGGSTSNQKDRLKRSIRWVLQLLLAVSDDYCTIGRIH